MNFQRQHCQDEKTNGGQGQGSCNMPCCSETPLRTSSAASGVDWLPSARMLARKRDAVRSSCFDQQLFSKGNTTHYVTCLTPKGGKHWTDCVVKPEHTMLQRAPKCHTEQWCGLWEKRTGGARPSLKLGWGHAPGHRAWPWRAPCSLRSRIAAGREGASGLNGDAQVHAVALRQRVTL